ncbi:MAG TPA: glycosyltransferase family 39 protein, partial [Sumerlaeia bacterium]|nr:glycosyltransferase family 39 protein [Sumerlaeia bacterium]
MGKSGARLTRPARLMRPARERRIILSLFLAALALRLVYLLEMSSGPYFVSPQLDELNFDLWGRRIAFENFWGDRVFPRGPLYPYFLGILYRIFGHDYFLPRLAQSLFGALAVVLLYLIGKGVFGRTSAILGGALAVAFPTLIFFGGELLITSVFLPLSLLTLWLFLRWSEEPRRMGRLAAAGAVCGLSALARPNILLVTPFFALWSAWVARRAGLSWRGNFAGLVLLTASVVAVILPVTVRNWVVGRDFVLISSQGGINFYVGNNAAATGFTSATPTRFRYWGEYEDSVDLFARRQAEIETGRGAAEGRRMKPSEISRYWSGKAWRWIADHPADAARLALKKTVLFWSAVEIKNNKSISFAARFSRLLTVLLWILPFGLVAPLALAQMARRRPSASQALLIGFVICYMMSVAPFFVYARYRMPVVPVLLLYAAHWVVEAAGEMSRKRLRAVAIRLVLTGLFALLVWVDSYGARRVMRGLRHEDYWVAGNGYMISGRYEEAAQYYRLALK